MLSTCCQQLFNLISKLNRHSQPDCFDNDNYYTGFSPFRQYFSKIKIKMYFQSHKDNQKLQSQPNQFHQTESVHVADTE